MNKFEWLCSTCIYKYIHTYVYLYSFVVVLSTIHVHPAIHLSNHSYVCLSVCVGVCLWILGFYCDVGWHGHSCQLPWIDDDHCRSTVDVVNVAAILCVFLQTLTTTVVIVVHVAACLYGCKNVRMLVCICIRTQHLNQPNDRPSNWLLLLLPHWCFFCLLSMIVCAFFSRCSRSPECFP